MFVCLFVCLFVAVAVPVAFDGCLKTGLDGALASLDFCQANQAAMPAPCQSMLVQVVSGAFGRRRHHVHVPRAFFHG